MKVNQLGLLKVTNVFEMDPEKRTSSCKISGRYGLFLTLNRCARL